MRTLINEKLLKYIHSRESEFDKINSNRVSLLKDFANYIKSKENEEVNLTFICTHNSRRSHFGQIWAQTAAYYYNADNVRCYSGGTEATAFNPRAVDAIIKVGFEVDKTGDENNPVYFVNYAKDIEPLNCFSKVYDDDFNPKANFAPVMTCSHADENCPFIPGAEKRFAVTYEDPKEFDGTEFEEAKYDERCADIAREMLYTFSLIK